MAFNERTALGLLDRLERRNITVPAEMSVTGFDDSILARHVRIDLTTVSQAPAEQPGWPSKPRSSASTEAAPSDARSCYRQA
jgi:hypothetical protein